MKRLLSFRSTPLQVLAAAAAPAGPRRRRVQGGPQVLEHERAVGVEVHHGQIEVAVGIPVPPLDVPGEAACAAWLPERDEGATARVLQHKRAVPQHRHREVEVFIAVDVAPLRGVDGR